MEIHHADDLEIPPEDGRRLGHHGGQVLQHPPDLGPFFGRKLVEFVVPLHRVQRLDEDRGAARRAVMNDPGHTPLALRLHGDHKAAVPERDQVFLPHFVQGRVFQVFLEMFLEARPHPGHPLAHVHQSGCRPVRHLAVLFDAPADYLDERGHGRDTFGSLGRQGKTLPIARQTRARLRGHLGGFPNPQKIRGFQETPRDLGFLQERVNVMRPFEGDTPVRGEDLFEGGDPVEPEPQIGEIIDGTQSRNPLPAHRRPGALAQQIQDAAEFEHLQSVRIYHRELGFPSLRTATPPGGET